MWQVRLLPGSGKPLMLAKRRAIMFEGGRAIRTPILLPSFSSKGFPSIQKIFEASEEYISDEILVSAYDISYGHLLPKFDFASTVFLDSGGYEASKDSELSEVYQGAHKPKDWSPELHQEVVDQWACSSPTVFVTFDAPDYRMSVNDQIDRARAMKLPNSRSAKDFLIKPASRASIRLDMDEVLASAKYLDAFSIIGATEKELGNSLLERMLNIARLRAALDRFGVTDQPIHVFGSLDTLSTYLFFLAGADVFDGLTWLRYAFHEGDTIYRHNFGTLTLPIKTNSDVVEGRSWSHNYQYMVQMQLNMGTFTQDQNFQHFGRHAERIRAAYQAMMAQLGDG